MKYFKMNNGYEIPCVGSGTNTFGKEDHNYMAEINFDTKELDHAIRLGYRHFDTAVSYRNEEVLGLAMARSGINRDEFFITTKIPGKAEYLETEEKIRATITESLKKLKTDTIDLLLIHHPMDHDIDNLLAWNVLENLVDEGVLRSIGVSNFNIEQLEFLLEHGRIRPAVNQIESHPGMWNDDIIAYCWEKNIVPEAWGPLTRISDDAKEALAKMAEKYQKTWAQLVLRYQIERGVVVIPKSHHEERQKLNLEIFDFSLSDDDKEKIKGL